jgi:hypothetical protein
MSNRKETVTTIVRLRAPDWNTKKHERKEFIYYEEYWNGKNWLGIPIKNPLSGHIEGKYTEVLTRPKLDERTGEHVGNVLQVLENRIIFHSQRRM